MAGSRTLWRVAAAIYFVINAGGAVLAAAMGEMVHAGVHAALLLLGVAGYFAWRLARTPAQPEVAPFAEGRLDYLQQSVDAIAEEVERIGETQRYNDKLLGERIETPPKKENQ